MANTPDSARRPYADAAPTYWQAGWRGILPIPAHSKKIRVTGWTGNDGAWPSYPDLQAWVDGPEGDGNIALRVPPNVIGIDVDHYDGKPGGAVLAQLEHQHGPLPATWRTTSRDDGISGIRFYRVPEGLRWPGILGPGIETVRTGHRYAVTWPSVHPNGSTYRWITPHGATSLGDVPTIDELPHLPPTWVDALTGGHEATEQQRANLTDGAATSWLTGRPSAASFPCARLDHALADGIPKIGTGTSRHDATLTLTNRLIWLAGEGHHGIQPALDTVQAAFLAATSGDRTPEEADAEWERMITGAVNLAAAAFPAPPDSVDPCDAPFAGLIPPKTTEPAPEARTAPPAAAGNASASVDPAPTQEPPAAPQETPPSWARINLAAYLDGTYQPPRPTLFTRTDNQSLVYPGLVHSFHGESESGKSFIVQAEAAHLIATGRPVLFIDFESDPGSVTERMLTLGATPDQIINHFDYRQPEIKPNATPAELEAWTDLLAATYDLVIIDGVTDALGLFGFSTKENDDIAKWMTLVPKNIAARTGAAVIIIDHVTKDTESRGRFAIGGQAKMSGLTGAAFTVEVVKPLGRGLKGLIKLSVGKDRPGYVRGISGPMNAHRQQETARITVDSTGDTPIVTINPPHQVTKPDGTPPDPTRFTGIMERISKVLEQAGAPVGRRAVYDLVGGNKERTNHALRTLADEGYVSIEPAPRNGLNHTHVRPYRQHDDPKSDLYRGVADLIQDPLSPTVPECSPTVPGNGQDDCSRHRPSPKGDGEQSDTHTDPLGTASVPEPVEVFCRHCEADITAAGQRATTPGYRCYHCDHLADGSERP